MSRDSLLALAQRVEARGRALGAQEVSVAVSGSSHVTLQRRGGQVEQATQATTRGLAISLLIDDRYSSHSTSDLRPDALEGFLQRAVEATRYLEPDPDRRLPDAELCGRGVSEEALDQDDPTWYAQTADERSARAEALESALRDLHGDDVISSAIYLADGQSEGLQVQSNGFVDSSRGAWFAAGGEMTLDADGKRPESYAYYGARHRADLPAPEAIAAEIVRRTRERLGATSIESGSYPMVLVNRAAGRLLGVLAGPMSGGSLHEGRSCLVDHLGKRIGSELFTLIDDPTIPRGLGSRPWDGDSLVSRPRTLVRDGVLEQYNLGVYYARKLGMAPTSGSRSNWVVPPGATATDALLAALPRAIAVTGFLGGNANGTTGDFSFGIRGQLLEHGVPVQALSEMNVSGNITDIFERLVAVGDDPWAWSSVRSPTLLFDDISFSGA